MVKNLPANGGVTGETGSVPGLGRSPEEGMVTYSSILAWKNPKDRRACRITAYAVAELNITEQLGTYHTITLLFFFFFFVVVTLMVVYQQFLVSLRIL